MINRAARAMRCNIHDRFHRLPPFDSRQDLRPVSRAYGWEGTDGCML
jgi:hypothetical protein